MANNDNKEKPLLWTEHINRVITQKQWWQQVNRQQYRTDAIALMCRGIEPADANSIRYGLYTEKAFFWVSRLYVPFALFRMYRKGVFVDALTTQELKAVAKIAIGMHLIDVFGHFLFRLQTAQVIDKHTTINEDEFALRKKKAMDDYLIQKNYLKTKKDNKL